MKCPSYNNFFINFANKTKLNIILSLRNGPLNVTAIAKKVGEEESKVSHNLKKLNKCHVLDVKQKGRQRIYSLNKETVIPLLKIVEKHVKKNCPWGCVK